MTKQDPTYLEFLSQTNFTEKEKWDVIEICKNFQQNTSDSEIKTILDYYLSSNLTCLSPQERHYIRDNNKSVWIDYLIYRYRSSNYAKSRIISKFPLYSLTEPTSICNQSIQCVFRQINLLHQTKSLWEGWISSCLPRLLMKQLQEGQKRLFYHHVEGLHYTHN
jgi:hypothetical protein